MNCRRRRKKEPVTGHRKVNAGRGHDEGGQASQDGNDDKSGEDLRARSTKENLADLRGKRLTISHLLHWYQVDEGSARQYVDQSDDHNSVDKRTRHGTLSIATLPDNSSYFTPPGQREKRTHPAYIDRLHKRPRTRSRTNQSKQFG